MPIIEAYLDDLIKNSTLDVPAWNIEAARKSGKSGWNYIDGCMILAMIETWKITGEMLVHFCWRTQKFAD